MSLNHLQWFPSVWHKTTGTSKHLASALRTSGSIITGKLYPWRLTTLALLQVFKFGAEAPLLSQAEKASKDLVAVAKAASDKASPSAQDREDSQASTQGMPLYIHVYV